MVSIDIRDLIYTSHKGVTIENRKGIVKFTKFYSDNHKDRDAYTLKYDVKTDTFILRQYRNARLKETTQIPLSITNLIDNTFMHTATHAIDAYSRLVFASSLGFYLTPAMSYAQDDIAQILSAPIDNTQTITCLQFKIVLQRRYTLFQYPIWDGRYLTLCTSTLSRTR